MARVRASGRFFAGNVKTNEGHGPNHNEEEASAKNEPLRVDLEFRFLIGCRAYLLGPALGRGDDFPPYGRDARFQR